MTRLPDMTPTRPDPMGLLLILGIVAVFWGGVGVAIGYRWCKATQPERIEQSRLEAEIQVASRMTSLATELTMCTVVVNRNRLKVDSIHRWLHGVTPRRPGVTVVALPETDDGD